MTGNALTVGQWVLISKAACRVAAVADEAKHFLRDPYSPTSDKFWVAGTTKPGVRFVHALGHRDRNRYVSFSLAPVLNQPADEWPGEAIAYEDAPATKRTTKAGTVAELEPTQWTKDGIIRIRRIPIEGEVYGLVSGHLKRMEGARWWDGGGWADDPSQGGLSVSRVVPLLEVVVPNPNGQASIYMAWEADLVLFGRYPPGA